MAARSVDRPACLSKTLGRTITVAKPEVNNGSASRSEKTKSSLALCPQFPTNCRRMHSRNLTQDRSRSRLKVISSDWLGMTRLGMVSVHSFDSPLCRDLIRHPGQDDLSRR